MTAFKYIILHTHIHTHTHKEQQHHKHTNKNKQQTNIQWLYHRWTSFNTKWLTDRDRSQSNRTQGNRFNYSPLFSRIKKKMFPCSHISSILHIHDAHHFVYRGEKWQLSPSDSIFVSAKTRVLANYSYRCAID